MPGTDKDSLRALIAPRSIAVVGASDRPGSIGAAIFRSLSQLGFAGQAWAINPKHRDVLGMPVVPSLVDLPQSPDVVAFVMRGASIVDQLDGLEAVNAKAIVIYDGGFAETGEEGAALQRRIADFCRERGIALCGPNCMGILNPVGQSTTYKLPVLDPARLRGNVGVISQSGSITIGLLADVRRFGFSTVISSGNEAVTDAADYLSYLLDDPHTATVAVFLESVRSPQRFLNELRRASQIGKPVVVLKVGQSERAKHAVTTHTGALAGESGVFAAALRHANAIQVSDIDEMSEVLAACQPPRVVQGSRIGVTTLSGGHSELILDVAETIEVDLPPLRPAEMEKIQSVVGHISGDGNPIDAWGNGDTRKNFAATMDVVSAADFDAVVLCYDQNEDPVIESQGTAVTMFAEAAAHSSKPMYLLSTRSGILRNTSLDFLRKHDVGVLTGVRPGLLALRKLGQYQSRRRLEPAPVARLPSPIADLRKTSINEFDSKRLLAQFGIPVPQEVLAATYEEAKDAANAIGWPVVLKAVSDDVQHKTELGLVRLNIVDEAQLARAWQDLTSGFAAKAPSATLKGLLVQPMITGGVEVFTGLNRDPEWGLCLAFGLGGIFIEVIKDVSLNLLPLSAEDAMLMIRETKAARVLAGVRGAEPSDIQALAACLQGVARFGEACGPRLQSCDINPIKVLPSGKGCVAVDALITLYPV